MDKVSKKGLAQFIFILVIVAAFLSTVHLYSVSYDMELKIHAANHKDIISDTIKRINTNIERKIKALEQLANTLARKDQNLDDLARHFNLLNEWEDFYEVHYIDRNGYAPISSISSLIKTNKIPTKSEDVLGIVNLLAKAQKYKVTQISNFVETFPGDKGLIICTPVIKGNEYIGSLLGVISLNKINETIFTSARLNNADILFAISPEGEYILGPDETMGKHFSEYLGEEDISYYNYLDMMAGNEKTMAKHTFPIHPKEGYSNTNNYGEISKFITYAPLKIRGNFLLSVGMTTLAKEVLKSTYLYKLNLFLLALAGLAMGVGLRKYNKNCQESKISEAILQEKENNLKQLQVLNNELASQKEAYASLWEETAELNADLYEKNKEINLQKENYEALWEETIALNQELLEKNQTLVKLNEKIESEKEKLLLLNSIGELMVSSSNITDVLTNIVSLTKKILNFSTARILHYNQQKDTLHLILAFGYKREEAKINEISVHAGISGYAAKNKEIVLVNDVSQDARYIPELEETKAEVAIPLLVKNELIGVLDLQHKESFNFFEDNEQMMLLKVLGNNTAMVLKNYQLAEDVRQGFVETVKTLVKAIEAKDLYTSGHCERVKEISVEIGRLMGLEQEELEILELAALVHDIGKIGMPESILNKKGKLTNEEYAIVKKHPQIGYEMLEGVTSLERISKIILQHHERIDGKGYPNGLKDNEIDELAKILAVADAIDAMTSARPYRPVQGLEYVIDQLDKYKGSQFDTAIATIAKEILLNEKKQVNNIG